MCLLCTAALGLGLLFPQSNPGLLEKTYSYPEGIDGVSITLSTEDEAASVSYRTASGWSDWEGLHVENEQDPALRESNLVMFPAGTTDIRVRTVGERTVNPIHVTRDGIRYAVAGLVAMDTPRILTRSEWGADESLRFASTKKPTTSSSSSSSAAATPESQAAPQESIRERDCKEAVTKYPDEFKASAPVTEEDGKQLRWPEQYSPSVKLLVVHHTAIAVGDDDRSGLERMRALYQFHANNRGWGDIGYHYVVDDQGQIYEGRSGGDSVVGGHAYCSNVGTIGIALMGNFDIEKPTQKQMQSLQWLLMTLADKYQIDLSRNSWFHGSQLTPILGHRTLVSTDCPGAYVWAVLDQIRKNVLSKNVSATIAFPVLRTSSASSSSRVSTTPLRTASSGPLEPVGATRIEGRPGGEVLISLMYKAGEMPKRKGARIADVSRSNPRIGIMQERDNQYITVRGALILPTTLAKNESSAIRLRIKLPLDHGSYIINIGDIEYVIESTGKRARTAVSTTPVRTTHTPSSTPPATIRPLSRSSSSVREPQISFQNISIRIRLNAENGGGNTATIGGFGNIGVNDGMLSAPLKLSMQNSDCVVTGSNGQKTQAATVRIASADTLTLQGWKTLERRYRGVIECRVIDGALTLINELPIEQYMAGLAEEPDTEPYEKQRAFAITARTYAAYYADPSHRKFPGQPFDGSDSPAEFQAYQGEVFVSNNPRWTSAVTATSGKVLRKDGMLIRPPYFSSDDGRTRSPAEVGWANFPFAEIFASKPDPWCAGMELRGHGVGMSGCGAEAQAKEGKTAEQILQYYYPGAEISKL